MTRRLHLWDEADLDVLDAVAWYEYQRAGLGAELLIELDKENVRRALLQRFPYSVYFRVGDETVDVIAVLHQHRNPRTWEQRILE